jgi:hypothetical protein
MNRQQYIDALLFCYKAEAAGAMAGETAMALRAELGERQKLHLFCCIEEANMARCLAALQGEGQECPPLGKSIHRAAHKIGSWLGEGDWQTFLDRFGATIHPQVFQRYVQQARVVGEDDYASVDLPLFQSLVEHEFALMRFVDCEREGRPDDALAELAGCLSDAATVAPGAWEPLGARMRC